jgi:N-acetylglucosamine kinase-like BadF-type ATPase
MKFGMKPGRYSLSRNNIYITNTTMFFLGVDAGATKTAAHITDKQGVILGVGRAGSASFRVQTKEAFRDNIVRAIEEAARAARVQTNFEAACIGAAGLDTPVQIKEAMQLLEGVVRVQRGQLLVVNDVQLVHPSASDDSYGVGLITGTGSNFYGKNDEGEAAFSGGLGYLLSDEGSGYWIGREVLRAAVRSADGRGKRTVLEQEVLKKFLLQNARELADVVYQSTFDKARIAELSKLADISYKQKDEIATQLLQQAADDIADGVNAIVRALHMQGDTFTIVAIGGTFNSPFPFQEKIMEQVVAQKSSFIVCDKSAAVGAAKLARRLAKVI